MGNCHFKSDFDAENFTGKLSSVNYLYALCPTQTISNQITIRRTMHLTYSKNLTTI